MASHNLITLSGQIEWYKDRKIKESFHVINCRIGLPIFQFEFHGDIHTIEKPIVWININASPDDKIYDKIESNSQIFISNGRITNWNRLPKDSNGKSIPGALGELQFNLDVAAKDISLSEKPYPVWNSCMFSGKVKSLDPSGKMKMEVYYHNPKAVTGTVSIRTIPIVYPGPFDVDLIDSWSLVTGKICGKKPGGIDGLYIVAEDIVRL